MLCLVLSLIYFYGTKLSTNQNFYETSTLGNMLMTSSASLFLISFMITGIPLLKEPSRDQYLTLNSVLTRLFTTRLVSATVYSFHESKIMTKHIADLEVNSLITDCEGAWGSLLLLAAKLRQENCDDINTFIWLLCVSYRPLNCIILDFEFSYAPLC